MCSLVVAVRGASLVATLVSAFLRVWARMVKLMSCFEEELAVVPDQD